MVFVLSINCSVNRLFRNQLRCYTRMNGIWEWNLGIVVMCGGKMVLLLVPFEEMVLRRKVVFSFRRSD